MQPLQPMLATHGILPIDQHNYGYEVKWDGIRAVAYLEKGSIYITSRNLINLTSQYPELKQLADSCHNHRLIVDGEIIVFNANGQPSFEQLQQRMNVTQPAAIEQLSRLLPVTYIIFDLLQLDNESLLQRPYINRRARLESLALTGCCWQTPAYQTGNGSQMMTATKALALEGVMAKRLDSRYHPGKRSPDWIKLKHIVSQRLVIGGWLPGKGARTGSIGALLVGYYQPLDHPNSSSWQPLTYAGRVGSGLDDRMLRTLMQLLQPLTRPTSPFGQPVPNQAIFVEPRLVASVEFTEWTSSHTLRHPVFKGLCADQPPQTIILSKPTLS